jgi:hypothetical protein
MFNAGVDVRNYLPLYRNIIWATRGSLDVSWGDEKVFITSAVWTAG